MKLGDALLGTFPISEIIARAVREGLLARNPAEGEDLRLEVRREKKYGLELDEAMALVEAAGTLDQRPAPSAELRRRILDMRAAGKAWKALAADLGIAESTARRVDIHDDLQDELAVYKAARSATWQPGTPAFLNARGKRWTRNAIAQHVMPPASRPTRCGTPALRSLFAAGADQDYVAAQVGDEDVTTTNRSYRYVLQRRQRGEIGRRRQLAMRESAADIGRPLFPGRAAGS